MVILHCRVNLSVAHVSNSIFKSLLVPGNKSASKGDSYSCPSLHVTACSRGQTFYPLSHRIPFSSLYRFFSAGREAMKIGVKSNSGGFRHKVSQCERLLCVFSGDNDCRLTYERRWIKGSCLDITQTFSPPSFLRLYKGGRCWYVTGVRKHLNLSAQKLKMRCARKTDCAALCAVL
jgi:hypothetical protein